MAEIKYEPNSNAFHSNMDEKELFDIQKSKKVSKKKSLSDKFVNSFLESDIENVFEYVWDGVVMPKIKDFVYSVIDQTVSGLLYGASSSPRSQYGQRQGVNYNKAYDSPSYNEPYRHSDVKKSEIPNYKEVATFSTKEGADRLLGYLRSEIDSNGSVTLYRMYKTQNAPVDYTYQNYGWKDLSIANVRYLGNGRYTIELPRPVFLGE